MSRRSAVIGLLALVTAAGAVTLPAQNAEKEEARTKALILAAERTYWAHKGAAEAGRATSDDLYVWSRRWMDAALSGSDKPEDKLAAIRGHLARMTQLEADVVVRQESGLASAAAASAAEFYRVEAEVLLARARR